MKRSFLLFPLFLLTISFTARWVDETEGVNRSRLLRLVNEARAKGCRCGDKWFGPAAALTWSEQLQIAAQTHSNDMSGSKFFNHTGSDGSDAGQRARRAGYAWRSYGENIAWGHESEDQVIAGWLNSPGHCRNIMNPAFREMGVARKGRYWTQVLGQPR